MWSKIKRAGKAAELLIDLEEDPAARAVVIGMLRERRHYGQWQEGPFERP